MKTLILGGVRSGKSRTAALLASAGGLEVGLIATATALDEEMAARIARHRAERAPGWRVIEEPIALGGALSQAAGPGRVVIIDCLTLWLTNLLLAADTQALPRERAALLATLAATDADVILVGNEVGLGIVPVPELARRFADEAGLLHQQLAVLCERVLLMVAGIPLVVRAPRSPGTEP
jgi:adenosylcobinamide kinase/adenosylcobinamide-phosphate guanylyltransferase